MAVAIITLLYIETYFIKLVQPVYNWLNGSAQLISSGEEDGLQIRWRPKSAVVRFHLRRAIFYRILLLKPYKFDGKF